MDNLLMQLLKNYVKNSLVGVGAIAGKNCTINSITEITGGHRVTFLWTDDEETEHTSTLDVMDGVNGYDSITEEYFTHLEDGVNVRDFGAVGDGETDDSQAFLDALGEAETEEKPYIIVPSGTYNLNHKEMIIGHISFVGENKKNTVLVDANIVANAGIECIGLTFEGGTGRTLGGVGTEYSGMPVNIRNKTIAILCTPETDTTVHYKDCIFRNMGTASFAFKNSHGSDHKFTSDLVENCTFENLDCAGVYHSLKIDDAKYIGNTFKNIGETEPTDDGYLSWCGIKIGDTTNSNYVGAVSGLVADNHFENVYSRTDYTTAHQDEAYFVAFYGESLVAYGNKFINLVGYSHDREGLYFKATVGADVFNNYFENAGYGEGYINVKNAASQRLTNVHDNVFVGDGGVAMSIYAECQAINNYINIKNVRNAIDAKTTIGGRLILKNNTIVVGLDTFSYGGQEVSGYHSDTNVVKVTGYDDVDVTDNDITVTHDAITTGNSSQSVQVKLVYIQSTTRSVKCNGNRLQSDNFNKGIFVLNVWGQTMTSVDVTFENNTVDIKPPSTSSYSEPLWVRLVNDGCRKTFKAVNNVILNSGYALEGVKFLVSESGHTYTDNNKSMMKFDTQQPSLTWRGSGKQVTTNALYVETPNSAWIKSV